MHEALSAGRPGLLPANTTVEIHRAIRSAGQICLKSYILYGEQQGYEAAAEALAAAGAPGASSCGFGP